jgi:hypothetical protein
MIIYAPQYNSDQACCDDSSFYDGVSFDLMLVMLENYKVVDWVADILEGAGNVALEEWLLVMDKIYFAVDKYHDYPNRISAVVALDVTEVVSVIIVFGLSEIFPFWHVFRYRLFQNLK